MVTAMIAVAMIIGFSAFKLTEKKNESPFYPNVGGVYQATPLNPDEEGETWRCRDAATQCAAQFSSPPNESNQTPDGEIKTGMIQEL